MQTRSKLCLLLPFALACSETPTEVAKIRPNFVPACTPPRATVLALGTVSRVKFQNHATFFTVENRCEVGMALDFTATRSGAVARIDSVRPLTAVLTAGSSRKVFVYYRTGAVGTGTITFTATTDPGDSRSAVQQINVTN